MADKCTTKMPCNRPQKRSIRTDTKERRRAHEQVTRRESFLADTLPFHVERITWGIEHDARRTQPTTDDSEEKHINTCAHGAFLPTLFLPPTALHSQHLHTQRKYKRGHKTPTSISSRSDKGHPILCALCTCILWHPEWSHAPQGCGQQGKWARSVATAQRTKA